MEQFQNDQWSAVSEELQKIYAGQQLTTQRAMEAYTHVFNMCSYSKLNSMTALNVQLNGPPPGIGLAEFAGKDLYDKLKAFIAKHVNNLQEQLNSIEDEKFLEAYIEQWSAYKSASRDVDRIFSYLNRHWVRREIEEGNKEIVQVYDLAINVWKTEMFVKIFPKIKHSAALALVAEENGNEEAKLRIGNLLKALIESHIELGIEAILGVTRKSKEAKDNLSKYRKLFIRRLLDETNKRLRGEASPEANLQMPGSAEMKEN